MQHRNKSIKFNAIINGCRTILNLLFPLITFPYISRVLTVNEIGKYNFSDSIVSYFVLIAALGINQYAIREGTKYRNNHEKMSEFASEAFSINVFSTLLSYLALIILIVVSNKLHDYWICILILSIQICFTTIGTEWIYSIYEEYTYITIRSIVFKIISIVMLFIFVRQEGDYLKYAAITVIASVGSNILNYINIRKYCNIKIKIKFNWWKMLKPILVIFASNIAIQIYVNSDITMLGYLSNDYAVGIYSISTKIYTIIKNVLTAVLTVTIPRFSLYAGERRKDKYDLLLQKVINTLCIIIFPSMVGLVAISKNVIIIIAGKHYLDSQISLCILSVAILFSVFNGLFSQCVLLAYKRENVFLKCTIISALINISLNFWFISKWAEIGAAITTLISEFILCIMLYYKSRDLVSLVFRKKEVLKNLMSVLIASFGIFIICQFIKMTILNLYLQAVFAVICSILGYGIILILFRNEVIISNLETIKNKIQFGSR